MYQGKICDLGGNIPYRALWDNFLPNLADYYAHPKNYNIAPFRIFGNLYYVGDRKVCMHLVDTGDGLILFDSGFSHNYDSLLDSIRALGFSPADIKLLIHSHGHFDHFGGGDRLRDAYGTKVYMSAVDTDWIRQMPRRALMHLAPSAEDTICYPDETIEDGQEICLGNTRIKCVLAPGHTPGTMCFFFPVTDGETTLQVGYFGGVGFLTLYKEYLKEYETDPNMLTVMKEAIAALRGYPVDILIGNHPNHNCTLEKRQHMLDHPGENPFLDPTAWHIFLDALEKRRTDFQNLGY